MIDQQERTWQDSPHVTLTLGAPVTGTAMLAVTSARTVYVNAQSNGMHDPSIGLTVRGVRYLVSAHLEEGPGGIWDYVGTTPYDKRMHLYITRADWRKHDAVSDSARNVLAEAILAAVRRWVAEHETLLLDGEIAHVNNQIRQKVEKLAEVEAEAAALRDEIRALEAREQRAQRIANEP